MKRKFLMIFIVYGLNFLFHFGYDIFPNFITSIFFPVNESIWEHMKMIYTANIVGLIIEYFIYKNKTDVFKNNYFFNLFISGIVNIISFLVIYLPFYFLFGENMVVTLIILFISIVITQIVSYYIALEDKYLSKNLSIILIVVVYIIFGILTYYPIEYFLFYDPKELKYGI